MNIVVPLAGKEKEFESGGLFKPLIDVSGKPLIARCTERHSWLLGNPKNRLIFIVLKEHDGKFNASMRLRELYGSSAQIVVIPELTSGAACTVLAAKGLIDSQESLAIFLADIDFRADLEGAMARCLHEGLSGAIPCFPSLDKKYSYAEEGADGFVSRVAEKEAISQNASAGFYFFSHGSDFVLAAERMIGADLRVNGLFYVCPVYNQLVSRGGKVLLVRAEFNSGLGTLGEIRAFGRSLMPGFHPARAGIFAHRGIFGGACPENSICALSKAVLSGYSVELDVRSTKDGVLVVSHDSGMLRGFGQHGEIEGTSYGELSSLDYFSKGCRIAAFSDFLKLFKANASQGCQVAVHAKGESPRLLAMISEALLSHTLSARAFIFDISAEEARQVKGKYPSIMTGASIVDDAILEKMKKPNYFAGSDIGSLADFDVLWIDEWHALYGESFLAKALSSGKKVVAISPELHLQDGNEKSHGAVWRQLIKSGCTNICTDLPAELDSFLARSAAGGAERFES